MYEALCRHLRSLAKLWGVSTPSEAADAIEELQAQNNELLYRCGQAEALIDYYQTGKLLSNEPPKGET